MLENVFFFGRYFWEKTCLSTFSSLPQILEGGTLSPSVFTTSLFIASTPAGGWVGRSGNSTHEENRRPAISDPSGPQMTVSWRSLGFRGITLACLEFITPGREGGKKSSPLPHWPPPPPLRNLLREFFLSSKGGEELIHQKKILPPQPSASRPLSLVLSINEHLSFLPVSPYTRKGPTCF